MWVEELTLRDYRNYKDQRVSFSPALNYVVGANGEGKTNLLESLYFLATTKSHRSVGEKDLVRTGSDFFFLSCRLKAQRLTTSIDIGYSTSQRRKVAKVSGVPVTKVGELIGVLNVVLFSPEDLELVKGAPSGRRRFLDVFLSQVDKVYFVLLQQYSRVLAQRNECLKGIQSGRLTAVELEPWTEQFADLALRITRRRQQALLTLCQEFKARAQYLNQGKEMLSIEYEASLDSSLDTQGVYDFLRKVAHQEIKRGSTLFGPHRDDIKFLINGLPAIDYASQGQQRTAVLSLKLSELEYMRQVRGEYPVLLLDDVLSELDAYRRAALVDVLGKDIQAIITGTDIDDLVIVKGDYKILRIEQGKVI